MKEQYIALITALMERSEDLALLDLIYRILEKASKRGA